MSTALLLTFTRSGASALRRLIALEGVDGSVCAEVKGKVNEYSPSADLHSYWSLLPHCSGGCRWICVCKCMRMGLSTALLLTFTRIGASARRCRVNAVLARWCVH